MVAGGRELIDTLWNVNRNPLTISTHTDNSELIDTLWNVNTYFMIKSWALSCELIDTLWNVNLSTIAYHCGYFAN